MALTVTSNGSFDEIPECPLCLEPLGLDDINFYPCACRYQICRFCWHRIRTDENGLCPQCREMYSENPAEYTPPTADQLAKIKSEKKQKEQCKKQKVMEDREKLASVRVVQRNLVFVVGLSSRLADPEVLKRHEYFGKYGKIYKVVINNHTIYSGAQGPSVSAYVTYCRNEDASKAIAAVNNASIDGRSLKVSFGTTKYCTSFLRGTSCTKPDCMYLHELGDDEASFTKEDMQLGKHQIFEHATLASLLTGGVSGGGVASHKDHSVLDGGKGKQITSQRSYPSGVPDSTESALPASALPASAHWAQRVQSHGDNFTEQQSTKSSTSNIIGKSGKGSSPNPSSNRTNAQPPLRGVEHNGLMRTSSKKGYRSQECLDKEDTNLYTRAESLSPSTQKHGQSRNLDVVGNSGTRRIGGTETGGGGKEKEVIVGNRSHSRGSSMGNKSLTPNLSPKGTLSASSSIGSLGNFDAAAADESSLSVADGCNNNTSIGGGRNPKTSSEPLMDANHSGIRESSEGIESMFSGETWEDESDEDTSIAKEMDEVEISSSNGQQKVSVEVSGDTVYGAGATRSQSGTIGNVHWSMSDGTAVQTLTSPKQVSSTHFSPPGLSRKQQTVAASLNKQPLSLSRQSEMVCRKLQLEDEASVVKGSQDFSTGHVQEVLGVRASRSEVGSRTEEAAVLPAVQTNANLKAAPQFGGVFGSSGANGCNLAPSWTSHQPHPQSGNICHFPSSLSTPAEYPIHSAPPISSSAPPISSSHTPVVSSAPVLHSKLPQVSPMSKERLDDLDELGFDPCMVSQQGLAKLLDAEAEQSQKKQHQTYHQQHVSHSLPYSGGHGPYRKFSNPPRTSSAYVKGAPNGITALSEKDHRSKLCQDWKEVNSKTHYSKAESTGMTGVGPTPSFNMSSLEDEFRSLFPMVNISFGESIKGKADKSSSLGQALDDSKLSFLIPSSSSGHYSQQYGIHRADQTPASSSSSMSSTSSTPSVCSNDYFLGQTNPGFPSTCLRVRDQSAASVGSRRSDNSSSSGGGSRRSEVNGESRNRTSGGSSCLGPEWPGLGIAVAQIGKEPGSLVPSMEPEVPIRKSTPSTSLDQRQMVLSQPAVAEVSSAGLYNPMTGFPATASSKGVLAQGQVGAGGFGHDLPALPLLQGRGGAESMMAKSQSTSASLPGGVNVIGDLWRSPAALNVSANSGSSTSTEVTAPSLPSPPPGFSKPSTSTSNLGSGPGAGCETGKSGIGMGIPAGTGMRTVVSGTVTGKSGIGVGIPAGTGMRTVVSGTVTGKSGIGVGIPAGTGMGTVVSGTVSQTATSTTSTATTTANAANPVFVMNSKGQMIPSQQFAQAWTNSMRTLSTYTPAQLQQIAKNNQVVYQQLLGQQRLYQQAMLKNPHAMVQVQKLWMAQLHHQAMLHKQQQQQAAMVASASAGGPTTSAGNGTSVPPVNSSAAAAPQVSKLMGTMSNSGSTLTSATVTASSHLTLSPGSTAVSSSKTRTVQSDDRKLVSKPPVQQSTSDTSNVSKGQSKNSVHISNGPVGQQNSNIKTADVRHSKVSRNLTKSKVTGAHSTPPRNSSSLSDKKPRQKSSK